MGSYPLSCKTESVRNSPFDLDIFPVSLIKNSPWIQYLTHRLPVAASLCAISLVWCTGIWSIPPQWISNESPRYFILIAEHSICQPGYPVPQGESHTITWFSNLELVNHRAKSLGLRLFSSTCIRAPDMSSSRFNLANSPYRGKVSMLK